MGIIDRFIGWRDEIMSDRSRLRRNLIGLMMLCAPAQAFFLLQSPFLKDQSWPYKVLAVLAMIFIVAPFYGWVVAEFFWLMKPIMGPTRRQLADAEQQIEELKERVRRLENESRESK